MPNYVLILSTNYSNSEWTLNGLDYSGLTWLSDTPKPTQTELDALWQPTLDTQAKVNCKAQAKTLLANSDWSVLPDVQITNKADFENYRAILRGYVISPVVNPTWPTEPQPIWG
jgi:hypothetical protein